MKPSKESIAAAYDMKRRNKRKMMKDGGPVSAKAETRPMPTTEANDAHSVSRNDSKKGLPESKWTDQPTVAQAQRPSKAPISRPKIAKGATFATRDLRDQEEHLMAMQPAEPTEQPAEHYNELDAAKEDGDPDMAKPHTTRKAYAKGGMINEDVSMHNAENDELEHPQGLESDNDEMSLPVDEYMAGHFAEGGDVQPEPEAMDEHYDSIAAAIMARMKKYAEGGEVDIESNAEEIPMNDFDMLNQAALKENYDSDMEAIKQPMDSNLHDVDIESDDHDMVSKIRAKNAVKRAFR